MAEPQDEEEEEKKFLSYKIVSLESAYGSDQVGLVATRPIMASEVICVETPVTHVASAVNSTKEEILERHKNIYAPGGSFVAWTTEDARTELGGRTCKAVQVTIRLIMHQEPFSKKVVERANEMGYLRIFNGPNSTPSVEAYSLFKAKSEDHDPKFWTLANFERLYAHVSHYIIDGSMVSCPMSLGSAYCKTAGLVNHSCIPNAHVKLMPNKCYIIALKDIEIGEEITRTYARQHFIGYALPSKIRLYNRSILGFECKCGHCQDLPFPYGYEDGVPRGYDDGFKKIFQSFLSVPKGAEKLNYAMSLFNNLTDMFEASEDNPKYDILVAFKVSSMVLEVVHESTGIAPNMDLVVVLQNASDILMACSEINPWSDPIWLCRAAFARIQLASVKLTMAIDRLRNFDPTNIEGNEKKGKEEKKKKTVSLQALREEEKRRYESDVNLHSAGFAAEYLLVDEVFSIMFGPVVGPSALKLELTMSPTIEMYANDLENFIAQAKNGIGPNAYRQAKTDVLKERYEKDHTRQTSKKSKKKVCKAFLLGTCKKGSKCKRFHDEELKKNLDVQDDDEETEESE